MFKKKLVAIVLAMVIFSTMPLAASAKITMQDVGFNVEAVSWALKIAKDPKYGYDQENRFGPNYDCSSFLFTAYSQAGLRVGMGSTSEIRRNFLDNGFEDVTNKITLSTGKGLKKGDILLKTGNSGHAAMVSRVSGGTITLVNASINEKGTISGGQSGDQNGKEILTRSYYNRPWTCVLRPPVKYTQFDYYDNKGKLIRSTKRYYLY